MDTRNNYNHKTDVIQTDNNERVVAKTNLIQSCLERQFDNEVYAKFQQVLEYLKDSLTQPLYKTYNAHLMYELNSIGPHRDLFPDGYSMEQHVSMKIKFYAFRFVANVGEYLIEQHSKGFEKAEENFIRLIKILLYHSFTSKSDTANLALVELEQLCITYNVTLQALYQRFSSKFLRLIIKAILQKLLVNCPTRNGSTSSDSGNSFSNSNGSGSGKKANCVISYMTRAFEIFNVVSVTNDDIAQSLIIVTNLIHKEKYNDAIKLFMDYLAKSQNIDPATLLRAHIQAIVVSLLLRRKLSPFDITASLNKLCSFCDKSLAELLVTKFTFIKGRLLLHYAIDRKVVTDGIYYLSKYEKEEHEQPFEDEFDEEKHFIDYLNPSMIGILLGMDAHFTATRKDLATEAGLKQIQSLFMLISMLDERQVQAIHVKLLSTLSLLIRLRPDRKSDPLNTALRDLWTVFLAKLTRESKVSLVITISVALYDLIEDCPELIGDIYYDLICKDRRPELNEKLKSLFFIPNVPALKQVYAQLTPYVRRENSVSDLTELQQSLDCVLPLMRYENQKCHLIAINKIQQLLRSNQQLLICNMLLNQDEPLDKLISKTIEALLAVSSTQDSECLTLIAECLGILGAVNPTRLDHLVYGEIQEENPVNVTNMSDPKFIVHLIEVLRNSLFSDQRSESEIANYALQVVVKNFSIFNNVSIREGLSEEALKACLLCQNTSYIGVKRAQTNLSSSVYEKFKSENQYSYKDWLDKFSLNLISCIGDTKIQDVLLACSYIFKHNHKLAEYLIPCAIVHILLNHPTKVAVIEREIMAIVDEDIGVSTQDLDTVYTEDVRGCLQTLHFQCANMVFRALDAVNKLECDSRLSRANEALSQKKLELLREFYASIPKDKLAQLASKCRSYARALCYFEQYIGNNRNFLDRCATALQKVYIALDDTYEAAGIEMIRSSPTSITDDIANYEACSRYDKAFVCYNTVLETIDKVNDREQMIEDALRCLSKQGDHQRLYEKSKQLLSEYPHYKRNILPAAIEACWKLARWEELTQTLGAEPVEGLFESACVGQGLLISTFNESSTGIPERLKLVRHNLMKPLSIAMMDRSAYFRGYQSLLVLHTIEDFALSSAICEGNQYTSQQLDENTMEVIREPLDLKLNGLFRIWDQRSKLVQPSLKSQEPLLAWQRTICLAFARKYPCLEQKINIEVGRKWLDSADSARESRSFDQAFFCLIQARKLFGDEFHNLSLDLRIRYSIEHAKVEWDQGEQTKAIRSLKLALQRLKDHRLYNHLITRKEKTHAVDPFPQLNNLKACSDCMSIDQGERESFAALKMLLTHYSEEAAACVPETLLFMYEECVHLGVNQEEIYLRLARYYDRLLTYYMENPKLCTEQKEDDKNQTQDTSQRSSQNIVGGDQAEVYTKLMEHSIVAFGNSLKYGARYLSESMPRMLNLWYDLASKKPKATQPGPVRAVSSRIESTVRFIDDLKSRSLPPYYFMTAISLITTRVSHPHSGVSKKTIEILELLLVNYPYQIIWLMIAMVNDNENDGRKKAVKSILLSLRRKNQIHIEKISRDTIELSRIMVELCYNHGPADRTRPEGRKKVLKNPANIDEISPSALKFDFLKSKVLVPVQSCIRAILPTVNGGHLGKHVVFPEHNLAYIKGFEQKVRIYHSLQQPRQLGIRCDNGKTIQVLCKSGDDLRKDNRCMEFFNLLNRILRRDSQSNARFFEIPSFLVLPLESHAGIIEMVPNCVTIRSIVEHIYLERDRTFQIHRDFPKLKDRSYASDIQEKMFKNAVRKVSPPVFPLWFLRRFTEPTSWYMARLAFTRSCAISSIGGYIVGLGDRHLDNILIDTTNGRLVHVDFNLLFHQGEKLPQPECVPFRLTHNIVGAFGPMGTEGNFRKFCEIAMRVMRKEKDALLTTLKPFMHDPCSDWIKVRDMRGGANRVDHEEKYGENTKARLKIEAVERKLKGFPRSKFKQLTLYDSYSVEAQVDNLIAEATDTANLSVMYFGWCPHV